MVKRLKNSHKLLALGTVLVVAGGIVWFLNRGQAPSTTQPQPANPDTGYVNYEPPTPEEKQEVEQNKEQLSKDQPVPQPSGAANIFISAAGQYESNIEVSAYISNVIEDGGTCTLALSRNSTKVTRQEQGIKDARTTVCPTFSVPRSELPAAGQWTAVVSYSSAALKGDSPPKTVEVK